MKASTGIAIALLTAGCGCLSSQQVRAEHELVQSRNRARAEPAMLAAAKAHGAMLLPIEPGVISHRLPCVPGTDEALWNSENPSNEYCTIDEHERGGCQEWANHRRFFVIRDPGQAPTTAVVVKSVKGSAYARLARRDNKLYVLLPHLTSEKEVGTVTECTCDGMPRPHCDSTFGFLLKDAPEDLEVEEVSVPMEEEHLRTICETVGL